MKGRFIVGVLLAGLALSVPVIAGKKSVDCNKGQSLNDAIEKASSGDTISFNGVCKENIVIQTSGITLAGQQGAAIQAANPAKEALVIDGAQRVGLQSFTAEGGSYGIHVEHIGGVIVQNVVVQNNMLTGIFVDGNSSASISNSSTSGNGVDGIDAEDSSSLIFTGNFTTQGNGVFGLNLGASSSATLNSATVTASQNVLGVQISLSSSMFMADPGSTVNAVNNFTTGLTVVSGAHLFVFGGKIVASGNMLMGISLFSRSGLDLDAASQVSSFNNVGDGVHLEELSTVNLFNTPAFSGVPGVTALQVHNNVGNGISALLNSQVHMFNQTQIQSQNNTGIGLQVDNGSSLTLLTSTLTGNPSGDVVLTFGSRGEFTKNSITKLSCDATSLIRGDTGKTCPVP